MRRSDQELNASIHEVPLPGLKNVAFVSLRTSQSSVSAVPSKTYTAVLEGRMAKSPKSGEISAKIRPDANDRPKQVRTYRACLFCGDMKRLLL